MEPSYMSKHAGVVDAKDYAQLVAQLTEAKSQAETWKRRFNDVHNALGCDDATVTEVVDRARMLVALVKALPKVTPHLTQDRGTEKWVVRDGVANRIAEFYRETEARAYAALLSARKELGG